MAAGRRGSRRGQQEVAKVRPEGAEEKSVVRPRQQARGPKAAAEGTTKAVPAAVVVVSEAEVLAAVESLYADELKPVGRILKKRIAELRSASTTSTTNVDLEQLRRLCSTSASFNVEPEEGGDFFALLVGRSQRFVDIYDACDAYPSEMWSELKTYCESPCGQEMSLPGGRYACAQALLSYDLPCLVGYSLGRICHIAQLAITQKKILGYLNGTVVAYGKSQSKLKEHLAMTGHPVAATSDGADTLPVASLDTSRLCMQQILQESSGQVPLSNVKRFFRSKCNSELSETSLGYSKLSELLRGPDFQDICTVELRESGYVVIEVANACGSLGVTELIESAPSTSGSSTDADSSCAACGPLPPCTKDGGDEVVLGEIDQSEHERFCPDQPLQFELAASIMDEGSTTEVNARAATWQPLTPGTLAQEGVVIHNTFFDVAPPLPTPVKEGAARRARSVPNKVRFAKCDPQDDEATIDIAAAQTGFVTEKTPLKTPVMVSPSFVSPDLWPASPALIDESQNSFVWSVPVSQSAVHEPTSLAAGLNDFLHPQPPLVPLGTYFFIEQHI